MGFNLIPPQYRYAAYAVLAAILVSLAYFKGYSSGHSQYVALKATYAAGTKAAQQEAAKINTKNTLQEKLTHEDYERRLSASAATIERLSDNPTIKTSVSRSCTGPSRVAKQADGRAVDKSEGQSGETTTSTSSLETDDLRNDLQLGIDALNSELIWRDWYRGTR